MTRPWSLSWSLLHPTVPHHPTWLTVGPSRSPAHLLTCLPLPASPAMLFAGCCFAYGKALLRMGFATHRCPINWFRAMGFGLGVPKDNDVAPQIGVADAAGASIWAFPR
jgi:hypothetical protein